MNDKQRQSGFKTIYNYNDVKGFGNSAYVKFYNHDKLYSLPMHKHNFFEINIVLRGCGNHSLDDSTVPVKKGSFFVIPRGENHSYFSEHGIDVYHIILSEAFMTKYADTLRSFYGYNILFNIEPLIRNASKYNIFAEMSEQTEKAVRSLTDILETLPHFPESICIRTVLCIIELLCNEIMRFVSRPEEQEAPWISQMALSIDYIKHNFNRKINFHELAAKYGFSYSAYFNHFKKLLAVSPAAYQSECRIDNAVKMLQNGADVTNAALESGYYDSSHFMHALRSARGIAPKDIKALRQSSDANNASASLR